MTPDPEPSGPLVDQPGSPASRGRRTWRTFDPRWVAVGILVLCLAVDLPLLLLNLVGERPLARFWRLGLEWMAPALAEYVKLGLAAVVMAVAHHVRRVPVYASWSQAFLIVLADDALQAHERLGRVLVRASGASGQSAIAIGEAVVMGALALAILALVARGYLLSKDEPARRYTREALVLLVLLGFFAAGVDALHFLTQDGSARLLGLVEDGGQLVVLSLLLVHAAWHVTSVASHRRTQPSAESPPYDT